MKNSMQKFCGAKCEVGEKQDLKNFEDAQFIARFAKPAPSAINLFSMPQLNDKDFKLLVMDAAN